MSRQPITRANPYTPRRGALAGATFTSERQYRNALARAKGYRSLSEQQRAAKPVSAPRALTALRQGEQEARGRALDALARMRSSGLSLARAAREAGTTTNAVRRYAGSALTKRTDGRYAATKYDRLVRPMHFLTARGPIVLDVRDSRSAARIASHANAVRRYLDTGDDRALRAFWGRSVRVGKLAYPFLTDTATIDRLASAGAVHYESLYPQVA